MTQKGSLLAGMAGLSITYALNVTQSFNWLVRMASDWESQVVSVERVAEYANIPPEPPLVVEGQRPPPGWPSAGAIELRNFSLAYRAGLPKVRDLCIITCPRLAERAAGGASSPPRY